QVRADSELCDRRCLHPQALYDEFIQVIRCEYRGTLKPGFIEHASRPSAQFSEVSGVQTDSEQLVAAGPKLLSHLNGVTNAVHGPISVNQKQAIVGEPPCISLERLELRIETHYQAVRHCPFDILYRHPEVPRSPNI